MRNLVSPELRLSSPQARGLVLWLPGPERSDYVGNNISEPSIVDNSLYGARNFPPGTLWDPDAVQNYENLFAHPAPALGAASYAWKDNGTGNNNSSLATTNYKGIYNGDVGDRFTICCWAYITSFTNIPAFVWASAASGDDYFILSVNSTGTGRAEWQTTGSPKTVTSTNTAVANEWTFICTRIRPVGANVEADVIVNADFAGMGNTTITLDVPNDPWTRMGLHLRPSGGSGDWNGWLRDVRFYDRYLPDSVINDIYRKPFDLYANNKRPAVRNFIPTTPAGTIPPPLRGNQPLIPSSFLAR